MEKTQQDVAQGGEHVGCVYDHDETHAVRPVLGVQLGDVPKEGDEVGGRDEPGAHPAHVEHRHHPGRVQRAGDRLHAQIRKALDLLLRDNMPEQQPLQLELGGPRLASLQAPLLCHRRSELDQVPRSRPLDVKGRPFRPGGPAAPLQPVLEQTPVAPLELQGFRAGSLVIEQRVHAVPPPPVPGGAKQAKRPIKVIVRRPKVAACDGRGDGPRRSIVQRPPALPLSLLR
mmetsp:Transcript_39038/g.87309  ORF Transcript_39038/g.87309 Transcript_39038/m.87309 type:complete len:229 (+) Transcript_39038:461-1147(+)